MRSSRLGDQKNQLEQALLISRSGCTLVEGALTNADDQVMTAFDTYVSP